MIWNRSPVTESNKWLLFTTIGFKVNSGGDAVVDKAVDDPVGVEVEVEELGDLGVVIGAVVFVEVDFLGVVIGAVVFVEVEDLGVVIGAVVLVEVKDLGVVFGAVVVDRAAEVVVLVEPPQP
jgi:hypothetical protein